MKRITVVCGICISFLLVAALCAVGQDEHPSERPPNAPQEPRQSRPQAAPQEPARSPEQAHPQEQNRPDDRRNQQPEGGNRRDTTPQSEGRQPNDRPDQQSGDRHMQGRETHDNGRTYEGRPENGQQAGVKHEGEQRRIPDQDYRAHFGREHQFAPRLLQAYQGRPSFSYAGYTFVLVDEWPSEWVYDDDDYYIDYVDGEYWMYNVLYPGARVMVMVVQ